MDCYEVNPEALIILEQQETYETLRVHNQNSFTAMPPNIALMGEIINKMAS